MADVQFGAYVAARADKAAPVGADLVVVSDSAAAGVGKKVSLTNLVTAIVAAIAASTTHLATIWTALVAAYGNAALDIVGLRRNAVLAGSVANDTTSLADVTAFSFPVVANRKYWFRFMIDFTAAAAATGAGFTVNGPALTRLVMIRYVDTSTTGTTLLRANAAYDTPAVAVAASASTGANTAEVAGWIECSAGGNVILRFVSETGGSAITVLAGSVVEFMRVT